MMTIVLATLRERVILGKVSHTVVHTAFITLPAGLQEAGEVRIFEIEHKACTSGHQLVALVSALVKRAVVLAVIDVYTRYLF